MAEHEKNSLEDFSERFVALMDEAKAFGIRSLVVINDNDMLSDEETKQAIYRGGWANAIGLSEYAKDFLMSSGRE